MQVTQACQISMRIQVHRRVSKQLSPNSLAGAVMDGFSCFSACRKVGRVTCWREWAPLQRSCCQCGSTVEPATTLQASIQHLDPEVLTRCRRSARAATSASCRTVAPSQMAVGRCSRASAVELGGASCWAVLPCTFTRPVWALQASSRRTAAAWPCSAAAISAARPAAVCTSTAAPRLSSRPTTSVWPLAAATTSAVAFDQVG